MTNFSHTRNKKFPVFVFIFFSLIVLKVTSKVISPLSLGEGIKPQVTTLNDDKFLVTTFHSHGLIYNNEGSLLDRFLFSNRPSAHSQALLPDDTILVAWSEFSDEDSILRIYTQKFTTEGTGIDNEYLVSTQRVSLAKQESISVAVLRDGGFVVAWSWENTQEITDKGLIWATTTSYAQIFNHDVTPRGQRLFLLESNEDSWVYNLAMTHLGDGGFIIFWEEKLNKDSFPRIKRQSYDMYGEKIGNALTIEDSTRSSIGQMSPAVVTLVSGDIILAWKSWEEGDEYSRRYLVHAKVLNQNGVFKGAPFIVQTNGYSTSSLSQVSVAALNNNGFVIVWSCEEPEQVYFRVYGDEGRQYSDPIRVSHPMMGEGENRSPSITGTRDSGFIISWDFCTEFVNSCLLYAQKYDRDGIETSFQTSDRYGDL